MKPGGARRAAKRKRRADRALAHRHHIGASPGALRISEDAVAPRVALTTWSVDQVATRDVERGELPAGELVELIRAELAACRDAPRRTLWLDIEGVGDAAFMRTFGQLLELHPLALEDLVHQDVRPKCEVYAAHTVVLIRQLVEVEDGLESCSVGLVVGDHYVVSVRHHVEGPFGTILPRLHVPEGRIRNAGAGYLAYALIDAVVDGWPPIVDRLLHETEQLEDEVLEGCRDDVLLRVADLKRRVLVGRHAMRPMLDALAPLQRGESPAFTSVAPAFLRDVQDHSHSSLEGIENARELLVSVVSAYQSAVAQRTNDIMRVLAVVSTVFVPLTFLVGVWGMNFEHMPELDWRGGYPLALGAMALVAGGILWAFRRRGWLGRLGNAGADAAPAVPDRLRRAGDADVAPHGPPD